MIQNNTASFNIFCDGGARGNPGPAAIGVVIKNLQNENIAAFGKYIGETTNNVAEYTAVLEALNYLNLHKISTAKICFYLDSALVVNQLSGNFKIKQKHLKTIVQEIRVQIFSLNAKIFYFQIPREKNWQADRLVNQTLDYQLN